MRRLFVLSIILIFGLTLFPQARNNEIYTIGWATRSSGRFTLNQNLRIADSPTFAGLTLSGLTASTVVYSNATKAITSLANGAGYLLNDGSGGLSWGAVSFSGYLKADRSVALTGVTGPALLVIDADEKFATLDSVAAGQVLASAGTGTLPAYTASPTLTSVTVNTLILPESGKITHDGVLFGFLNKNLGNSFLGGAGNLTSTGTENFGAGYTALRDNLSGVSNVAVGYGSMVQNSAGYRNVAVGYNSLWLNTGHGYDNVAVGYQSLKNNSSGYGNTGVGIYSIELNDTGFYNTSCGWYSGERITSGSFNTYLGANSGRGGSQPQTITNSMGLGANVYTTDSNQVVIGDSAIIDMLAGQSKQANFIARNYRVNMEADATVQFGQIVMTDADTDNHFDVNTGAGTLAIGVLGGTGAAAAGTLYDITIAGKAYVAMLEDIAVTRGEVLYQSATAGYANTNAALQAVGLNIGIASYSEALYTFTAPGGVTTNTITLDSAPGWAVNDPVIYWQSGDATVPTGLTTGTVYFIKTIATAAITLSATKGGAAVAITQNTGSGTTMYFQRLPQAMVNIR